MKLKLLITSCAMLYAGVSAADVVVAKDRMQVAIGGELDSQIGVRINKGNNSKTPVTPNGKDAAVNTAATLHVSVKNKTETGLTYGAQVGIKTNVTSDDPAGKDRLDRTYIFLEKNDMGRVEIGSNRSAGNQMKITGTSVGVGSDGWIKYAAIDTKSKTGANLVESSNFLLSPKMAVKEGSLDNDSHERYRKVTYYTPIFQGFQGGLSYGFDASNRGVKSGVLPNNGTASATDTKIKDIVSGGLTYSNQINKTNAINLSLTGEYAKENIVDSEKIQAVMIGAEYKLNDTTFAASYGNNFKSGFIRGIDNVSNSYSASGGVMHDFGKLDASLTYLHTSKNKNSLNAVSAAASYDLAPGILPYAEVTHFKAHQKRDYNITTSGSKVTGGSVATTDEKSKGLVFILGTKVTF